ncbi:palmitoyltransferase ZDHHC23 isoform X3 [Anabrus simplex]|uniref:palmitoyltransferase ZDHHC23 isoform X3 n=1 Tax=Anabrus simplex TaxID=316456 RepID=UPI0035A33C44
MPMSDWRRSDPLCCCEYVNSNDERSHILECCCNCEVLDQTCERLNCCIGEKNSSLFVLGIFLSFLSLIYGAVLTLTTVCHPVYIMEIFLLPDDCSDVYHNVEMAVCFVSAVYSLLLATVLLVLVIHHSWLISLGLTGQEWQELQGVDGRCCGMYADRPYNKGVLKNWQDMEYLQFLQGSLVLH